MDILCWFVPFVLGWALLSLIYWSMARPVLHDAILFRIYSKRDALRLVAIDGGVKVDSFEYTFLEKRLSSTAYVSPEITLCNFIRFYFSEESKSSSPELDRFSSEASPEVRDIWDSAIDDVMRMMLANSPVIATFGVVGFLAKSIHKRIAGPAQMFFEAQVVAAPPQTVAA